MIALGYDYGTTNSIIVKFDSDMTSDRIKNTRKSERMPDGQSPKRLLNDREHDSASVLDNIRDFTQSMFGEVKNYLPDDELVITLTIPNTFRDVECLQMRDVVMNACCDPEIFGNRLNESDIHILPEPVAAALYYVYLAHETGNGTDERYLIVYDVGGGTSDFAVIGYRIELNAEGKKIVKFSVKCTAGELILGGDDFDEITEEYMKNCLTCEGTAVTYDVLDSIRKDREAVKCRVAARDYIHYLFVDDSPVTEGGLTLKRKGFEAYVRNSGKLKSFTTRAEQLLEAFKKKINEEGGRIEDALGRACILPVGGSSKIPLLQEEMERVFKCKVIAEMDFGEGARFESVSRGAAIYSACMAGMLDDIADIEIEERVLHRISYLWGEDRLHTCVEKNYPSGDYHINLRPSGLQRRNDGTFVIGQVHFYEGEGDVVDRDNRYPRNDHLRRLAEKLASLNDPIYLNGRLLSDISVTMKLEIRKGRLQSVDFTVPKGSRDGSDYYSGPISIQ